VFVLLRIVALLSDLWITIRAVFTSLQVRGVLVVLDGCMTMPPRPKSPSIETATATGDSQSNQGKFLCKFAGCDRSFIRKEHLVRHSQSHSEVCRVYPEPAPFMDIILYSLLCLVFSFIVPLMFLIQINTELWFRQVLVTCAGSV
jgi:hypothetical protein